MGLIPDDFQTLLPKQAETHKYDGPLYWLFCYNPMDASVTITHNEDRPRAEAVTHEDIAPEVVHPGRINGFAYKIQGGFRITDDRSRKIEDPFITSQVTKALKKEETSK